MRKYVMIWLVGLFITIARGKTWQVDTTGAEGDTLQKYVNLASDSAVAFLRIDTVLVSDGTYHLCINYTVGDTDTAIGLIMRDSVVLMSTNGASSCTLSGLKEDLSDTAFHCIWIDSLGTDTSLCKAVIKGFSITDGNARASLPFLYPHNDGGGIYCYYSSPVIDSCIIQNNFGGYYSNGGGLYISYYSSPIIKNNIIQNDTIIGAGGYTTAYGGGIGIYNYSSPTITNNTIRNNAVRNAYTKGGGISIHTYCSPTLTDNIIQGNNAWYGGGISIENYSSPVLNGNTISSNTDGINRGGGVYIYNQSTPTLNNNTISNNSASWGDGGGVYIYYCSPILNNNTISYNSAIGHGGGVFITDHALPILTGDAIYNNAADTDNDNYGYGGGLYIESGSNPIISKCLIANNVGVRGGAVYIGNPDTVFIDSSFIVDNGNMEDNKSGLAYILAYIPDTSRISHSHLYYNTYQPDTEIYNPPDTITLPLTNNFWWSTDSATIQNLIDSLGNIMPFETTFIAGVPGEPVVIDSVRNYTDSTFTTLCDSIWQPDTLYLRVYGQDRVSGLREAAVVIMRTSLHQGEIAVALVENDTNSGVYEGKAYVFESTGGDTQRIDDIHQYVKVNPSADIINIRANVDTLEWFSVIYKHAPAPDIVLNDTLHNFGGVAVNDSALWKFFVKNEGELDLVVDSFSVNSPFSVISAVTPLTIVPGDSDSVIIKFKPTADVVYNETLMIYSNDPNEGTRNVCLNNETFQNIVLSDTLHNFGDVAIGDTASWHLYIKNEGTLDLIVDSLLSNNAVFYAVSPTFPETLVSGDSIDVSINYTPPDTGIYGGIISIYSNDPDNSVATVNLSAIASGIEGAFHLPQMFNISQNTPNPFIKRTVIRYQVPKSTKVTINVFDITGRDVKTLIDKLQSPGYYRIEWDGSNNRGRKLSPGVYFYRINTNEYKDVRKLIILR